MAEPVEMNLFQWALTALAAAGSGVAGWLFVRQDRLDSKVEELARTAAARHETAAGKHDNDLADLWQALNEHRKEVRETAAKAEEHSREFRERTLRELGDIKASLASLAHAPQSAAHIASS